MTTQHSHDTRPDRDPSSRLRDDEIGRLLRAAAVFAVQLIARIDDLQTNRPWVPWWAVGQPSTRFEPPAR